MLSLGRYYLFFICFFIASNDASDMSCSILHASSAAVFSLTPSFIKNEVRVVWRSYIFSPIFLPSGVNVRYPSLSVRRYPFFLRIPTARLTLGLENPMCCATSRERTALLLRESTYIVSRYICPDSFSST